MEDNAKSPEALALGLAQFAARFYDGTPMPLTPKEMVEFHVLNLPHMTLLDAAGVEDDVLIADVDLGDTSSLWMCPLIPESLARLSSMSRNDLMRIAGLCRERQPALKKAVFANLAGDPSCDLGSVIQQWADRTLAAIEDEEDVQGHARMEVLLSTLHAVDFAAGATSLQDLDLRIEEACALEGFDSPASIGTVLLRSTGLVDADTWKLGAPDGQEVIAGIPYALALAAFAHRAGIAQNGASLQDAYEALVLGSLQGHANCLASGGIRSGEWEEADAPRFVVHSPATLHVVADALLEVLSIKGEFEAARAASRLYATEESAEISPQQAQARAEERFVQGAAHQVALIKEALCIHLDEHLPSPYPGDEVPADFDPAISERIAARLSNALRLCHPEAEAITPDGRHRELCKRIEQSFLP